MTQYRIDFPAYLDHNKTIYEVMMLSEGLTPSGSLTDAFGRLRTSSPFTLFDSSHIYQQNDKWSTQNTTSYGLANAVHIPSESTIHMNIGNANGDSVVRETKRVFPYQPGKSLLVMNSFAMSNGKANLTQRIGYYKSDNGVYLENKDGVNYFVLRSNVTGIVSNTAVAQTNWNVDDFSGVANSGSAYSATTRDHGPLNTANTNIVWFDIEWLGVGDIRCGFIVDGKLVPAHVFHNDNLNPTTYMTTSTLPIRYEILNTDNTTSNSTMTQICSTVISEGGYQGRSKTYSIGTTLAAPKTLPSANTFYPVMSIRLANNRLNSVVLPTHFDILTLTNNANYRYKLLLNATLGNTTWQTHETTNVEYDLAANNVITDGTTLNSGYVTQGTKPDNTTIGSLDDFNIQLGRTLTGNSDVLTIAAESDGTNAKLCATMQWFDLT